MARKVTPLTAQDVKNAKPREKDYKLFDGRGLYLQVTPSGGKHWKLKYRFGGKERKVSIGAYPEITLAKARSRREEIRTMLAQGIDPNEAKRQQNEADKAEASKARNTFYKVSQAWWRDYASQVSEKYHDRLQSSMRNYIYPFIKDQPIDEVKRLDIVEILEHLKSQGVLETARRTAMQLNQIYKYAVTHEYVPHNIIADIDVHLILGKKIIKNYPAPTRIEEIRGLLRAIDDYTGDYTTRMALRVLPYVFVRSYNIRHMEWSEIDWEAREWNIPAEKMKMKTAFTLPLPDQVITLLEELRYNSTSPRYVFPSLRGHGRPLSNNTLSASLRRMGYTKDEIVPHSFRAIFSTIANEHISGDHRHGYHKEVIEACLAHKEPSKTTSAYNRAEYREEKRGLMQWYADFLEGVKNED